MLLLLAILSDKYGIKESTETVKQNGKIDIHVFPGKYGISDDSNLPALTFESTF